MEWLIFVGIVFLACDILLFMHLNQQSSELVRKFHSQEHEIRALRVEIADKLENAEKLEPEFIPDVEELSQNEFARLARKREFDKRIAEMREELGFETYGTHAEELLPEVKNLPHNIIPTSLYDLPSVEIAD